MHAYDSIHCISAQPLGDASFSRYWMPSVLCLKDRTVEYCAPA